MAIPTCSGSSGSSNSCDPCDGSKDVFAEIGSEFAYPDVGYGIEVIIANVTLAEGQPISHATFGTLYVADVVDPDAGVYRLENRGSPCNPLSLIGRPVPCGTQFWIGTDCNCTGGSSTVGGCNQLTADFFVPAVNATSPAQVDNFAGFSIGNLVIIRSRSNPASAYTFTLTGTSGTNILILQNDGDGGTPGDVYKADADCDGNYDFCVEPLTDATICEQAVDTQCITHLIGCDAEGNLQKIRGTLENQALVYDPECEGYTNKVVPEVTTCVTLTTCFQVAPLEDLCDRQQFIFQTNDDALLLEEAAAALLSEIADPIITICGYNFLLDLEASVEGALVATPLFNPDEVVFFGGDCTPEDCAVCVPADCCDQCNPQVAFPINAAAPIGLSKTMAFQIPTAELQTPGEFLFTAVKTLDGLADLLFLHDNVTKLVSKAFNGATGAEIPLIDLPGDVNEDYSYTQAQYCNEELPCPVEATVEEDTLISMANVMDGTIINANHHASLWKTPCDDDEDITETTQYNILNYWTGETHSSLVSVGQGVDPNDHWMGTGPNKVYENQSGFNKRSMRLDFKECLNIKSALYISVLVEIAPDDDEFIFGQFASTQILRTYKY